MLIRSEKVYDGDIHPIAYNETKKGRAENRKVDVKLIPEGKEL